jgi:hypothetical protein
MLSYLPSLERGYLPAWIFFIAVVSLGNTAQCLLTGPRVSARVYNTKPGEVTPLASRFFAVWTAASACIRLYASYHITNAPMYDLAWWSYVLALVHYATEVFYYRTASLNGPAISPCIVASKSPNTHIHHHHHTNITDSNILDLDDTCSSILYWLARMVNKLNHD